jgi:hypothetical protein
MAYQNDSVPLEYRTGLSDRELLIRIDTRLENVIKVNEDHEARIRTLQAKATISPKQLWGAFAGAVGTAAAGIPLIQWVVNK